MKQPSFLKLSALMMSGILQESPYDTYDGMWEEDRPNGQGTRISKNGEKFVGTFVNWSLTGPGELFGPDGTSLQKGQWKDDQFLG